MITQTHFEQLLLKYPEIPNYPLDEPLVKIPAAWLIDQLGFKGTQHGAAGGT